MTSQRSDFENYVDGEIQFALVYAERGRKDAAQFAPAGQIRNAPIEFAVSESGIANTKVHGKIRYRLSNYLIRQHFIVGGWNQQLMLIDNIEFVDKVEKIGPPFSP
jgi:hypothetical protein